MKLIGVCTPSHEILRDEWFLPTLPADVEAEIMYLDHPGKGSYMQPDWSWAVLRKSELILDAINTHWGDAIVYADMDIQFFSPFAALLSSFLEEKDFICQLDDPRSQACTGFFAMRCNDGTRRLWNATRVAIRKEQRDQHIFNELLRNSSTSFGFLPVQFFGGGTWSGQLWEPGAALHVPANPVMHHANWCVSVPHKIAQLEHVRRVAYQQRILAAYCLPDTPWPTHPIVCPASIFLAVPVATRWGEVG